MKQYLFLVLIAGWFFAHISSAADAQHAYQNYLVPKQHVQSLEPIATKLAKKYQKTLTGLQIVFLIDRSGSMLSADKYAFQSYGAAPPSKFINPHAAGPHWKRMDSCFMIASHLFNTMIKYDKDGIIPVYFFGSHVQKVDVTSAEQLFMAFSEHGPDTNQTTNLKDALKMAYHDNIGFRKHNTLFVIITDGKPNGEEKKIEKVIYEKVAKKDPKGNHLNNLFVRIGDDPGAIEFLTYIDEECKKIKNNVDTKEDDVLYKLAGEQVILEAVLEDQNL